MPSTLDVTPLDAANWPELLDTPEVHALGADILVLSPTPTAPTDQGNRKRIYSVCRELQRRGARVHFVYFPQEWWFEFLPDDLVRDMGRTWDSFHLLPTTRHTYCKPAAEDYTIDEWWDEAIGTYLQWLFKRQKFDAFIVNYAFMSKALEYAPRGTLKILDTHDQFTGRRQLLADNGIPPDFFYTTADQEAIALNRADLVWAIKEEEARHYRALSKTRCITMPHVEPESRVPRVRRAEDEDCLVVGMLGSGNAINVNNARAFVKVALPILQKCPKRILIRFVGAMCSRLPDLEGIPGVQLIGPVDTVEEFYRDVDLVIVPLAFSTGLKIKAVEAFATGMPIVAMGHALEGIPTHHPLHQLHTMEEVARACCDVATLPGQLDELQAATLKTYALVQAQAKVAFDVTLGLVVDRPTVIMTLDKAFFEPDGLYREHVFQTINLLQQLVQVILYVDQPLPSHQVVMFEAFHGLAPTCRLAVAPGANTVPGRSLGLSSIETTLESLLGTFRTAILWVLRVGPELKALAEHSLLRPTYVRMDVLRLLAPGGDTLDIGALARHPGQVTLIDCHEQPMAAAHETAAMKAVVVPFWRWKPGRIGDFNPPTEQILMLARPDQWPLVQLLLPYLNELHHGRAQWQAVMSGPLPLSLVSASADAPPFEPPQDAAQLTSRFANFRHLPKAVVDLSGNDMALEVLRESLRRGRVPIVVPGGDPQDAGSGSLHEALDTLMRLPDEVPDWRARAEADMNSRYGSDAGWTQVWTAISMSKVLG